MKEEQKNGNFHTEIEKKWMSEIENHLKEEPTLTNMENSLRIIEGCLKKESEHLKWWNKMADHYFYRDDLKRRLLQAKKEERKKLKNEIKEINQEIKKNNNGMKEKEFHEIYDAMTEKHAHNISYGQELREKLRIGINYWKHAAVREIYAKYPELKDTSAGIEIATELKQLNRMLSRELTREEIDNRAKIHPNSIFKRLSDAFEAAEQEKKQELIPQKQNIQQKHHRK